MGDGCRNETNLMNELLSQNARAVLLGERRCTATAKETGERCGRAPALGQTVCNLHGAKSPLSIQAARERLLEMVEPALAALLRTLESHGAICPTCGRSDSDRDPTVVSAARVVLDRCGFHPTIAVQHVAPPDDITTMTPYEALEEAESLAQMARALIDQERDWQRKVLPPAPQAEVDEVVEALLQEPVQEPEIPIPSGIGTPEKRTGEK